MLRLNFTSIKFRQTETLALSATRIQPMLNTVIQKLKSVTSSLSQSTRSQNKERTAKEEEKDFYPKGFPIQSQDGLRELQSKRKKGKVVRVPEQIVKDERLVTEYQDESFSGYTAATCECGVTANVIYRPSTLWKCNCKRYNALGVSATRTHENPTIGPRRAEIERASKLAQLINNLQKEK